VADAQQRGMGRGLSAILPQGGKVGDGLREIPLDLIQPNSRQPRRTFDQARLAELAESIRTRGVLQPVVVTPLAGGTFELVAGERRLRAAQMVELPTIPALVRDTDDWERLDLALAENMARVDLNPIEEARACAMLVDDLGLTKQEVGRRVGRSRVAISNLIRLLDLPEEALELILCKDHGARRSLALEARDGAWSVRETERHAREAEGQPEPQPKRFTRELHPDLVEALAAAEDTLSAALGQPVRVRARGDGCRAELSFDSPAEAVALAERMLARGHLRAA
jgi:ParB family chromosome partitioning protein